MIESIKIRNFRGIKEGQIDEFRKINLLVGPNNSGKSALLEAIYLACTNSREAGLVVDGYGSTSFSATITDADLLGDYPMQRILTKHNYNTNLKKLSDLEIGLIKVQQENPNATLQKFDISPIGKFSKDNEVSIATFGLKLEADVSVDQQRITELIKKRELFETERKEIEKKLSDAPDQTERSLEDEEMVREYEGKISNIVKELSSIDSKIGSIKYELDERQEHTKSLINELIGQSVDNFEKSRLIYCWHPQLSYNYKADSAWVVKGVIPNAQNTILYDISKVTGHIPIEVFQKHFIEKPNLLRNIAKSFNNIFELGKDTTIQFLPAPENHSLLQGWVAPEDQQPIPIDGYGDGARSAFKLLVALHILASSVSEESPGILIWEEPELFQNPQTLEKLLKEVVSVTINKDIQIFIASHSLESIAHFTDFAVTNSIPSDTLMAFRLNLSNGVLSYSWFENNNLVAWLESGIDPRLWKNFLLPLQFSFRESGNYDNRD